MNVLQISPKREDVAELLRLSDEYAKSLYPAESNHLDDPDVLSQPNVYFVGAFKNNALVGIGAVKVLSHEET